MIDVEAVSYRTPSAWLVRDVSFRVAAGQVLALVGPNGAGKSTLLRLISGELRPSSGRVNFGLRPVSAWSAIELARRRAVLAQNSELTFAVRCEDVVMLGRAPHVALRETSHDRCIVCLALGSTDTQRFARRSYPSLSGGERKRVDAARCFAQVWAGPSARALLLDEPTAGLDLAQQHGILSFTREMAESGCAVICVLHDLNLAAQYADRLAVMDHGQLVRFGPPREVLTRRLLADVFEMDAAVVPHPELGSPVVICNRPSAKTPRAPGPGSKQESIHDA